MRILAIGDQHFTTKNIKEIETFIDVVTGIAEECKPDLIVLLGDLLHTHEKIHTVPLNKAYTFIKKMRDIALTYVIVGNHDYINASQFLSDNHWLNSLKEWPNVVVVDKVVTYQVDDDLLVFSPYVEPERFLDAMNTIDNWRDASVIFCHQEFYGCNMNGNYVSNQGKWDLSFPQVVSGHIHTKQHLQKNIYYTGSSMETEWKDVEGNENSYNTIAVLSVENKKMTIEEKEIRLHRKLKVHLKIEDLESFVIPEENAEDQIRLQISGIPYEEFNTLKQTTKYKELIEKDIKVDFEFNKSEVKVNNQKLQAIINDSSLNDFKSIFETLARGHKEPYYHELYELIMNNRVIKSEDIFILKM
jgi:DNA repair exonuclease SbcCD nuclease subunit